MITNEQNIVYVLPLLGAHNYRDRTPVNAENCPDLKPSNQAKARSPDTLAVVRNAGPRWRQYTDNNVKKKDDK